MPRGSEKANEFERYRQILAVLYVSAISAGFLLLAASVVKELFFRPVAKLPGPVLPAEKPDPESLARCHADVAGLHTELGQIVVQLLALPHAGQPDRIMPEWEAFSRQWLMRWESVDARCRFSELSDTHMGEAYDVMAEVHGGLPAMRLKYQSLLVRFDDEQAADLARMQRQLDRSTNLLQRARRAQGEEAP